jgi:hypothetical protein
MGLHLKGQVPYRRKEVKGSELFLLLFYFAMARSLEGRQKLEEKSRGMKREKFLSRDSGSKKVDRFSCYCSLKPGELHHIL